MNEHPPLEPVGDASLEARIVAWVLGEASAFEAGELERLCDERPELLVFRRRMRALHGLLSEAESAEPGDAWKLPPDKRVKIEELFGESQPEPEIPVLRPATPRRWLLKTILTAAACVMFGMLYRFGFSGVGPSSELAMNEPRAMKSMPAARRAADQSEVVELSASSRAKSVEWYGLADENGRADGKKQAASFFDAGGKPSTGEDAPYRFRIDEDQSVQADSLSSSGNKDMKPQAGLPVSEAKPDATDGGLAFYSRSGGGAALDDSGRARGNFAGGSGGAGGGRALNSPTDRISLPGSLQVESAYAYDAGSLSESSHLTADRKAEAGERKTAEEKAIDLAEAGPPVILGGQLGLADQPAPIKGTSQDLSRMEPTVEESRSRQLAATPSQPIDGKALVELESAKRDMPAAAPVPAAPAESAPARPTAASGKVSGDSLKRSESELLALPKDNQAAGGEPEQQARALESLDKVDKDREVTNGAARPAPAALQQNQLAKKMESLEANQSKEKAKVLLTPPPAPTDEISASGEAFSTFSLHVSDASFKVAKAALDRGERPDPESVRPEEFYNAFDYGDPTPAPGEPVACAIEQAAHPILPQRNLVRIAMRTGAAGRAASQPLNLTVLLDHSGSMEREDRHEGLNQAIVQLASLLKAGDTITVAGFSRTPRLMADRLPGERAKELVEIVRNTPSEGGTNLEEALKLGADLALRQKNPAAQNRIVLLTDGAANLGNAKPEDLAERIRALRQQGISFDAAGLGAGGVNDRMLETLTRDGNGRYYLIDQPSDADANFAKQLAGAFRPAAENVKVQVRFNPARVGRYKLIGFEKHRLKTEDFRNDQVDAAELAAEEAGVALYQVETLPQGSGEIGEASVRFKDAATGRMVEQTWTIPYDEKAAAFDQATPSMQLASLAALTAEKLRGGPLAEATDFQSLTPQISKVRSYYKTSRKVGDLIEMIGKLK